MENPISKPEKTPTPSTCQILSPSSSGRRSNASNSSEFEFWLVRNPCFPQPHLLSADELFVDGFLLPLCLLPHHSDPPDPEPKPTPETLDPEHEPEPGPGPESSTALPESSPPLSTSKRWRDVFKMGEKKTTTSNSTKKDKEKKKERKNSGSAGGAELNINLWPFSRSHSAGNNGNRPKLGIGAAATRKVSSAPCSRSNSAGESKSKKWRSITGKGGVHLGRSSPVWQVPRGGSGGKSSEPGIGNGEKEGKKEGLETRRSKNGGGGGARTRVLNLNVPMCIGYRHHLSCRSDENSTVGGGAGGGEESSGGGAGNGGNVGNLFNLRTLFSKKVY